MTTIKSLRQLLKPCHHLLFYSLILFLPLQIGQHFWPPFAYISGIRVDYLSPTLYLTDLIIIFFILLWLIDPQSPHPHLKKSLPLFLFLLLSLVNLIFSLRPFLTIYSYLRLLEIGLLFIYLKFNSRFLNLQKVSLFLFLATLYSSLIALAQFISQRSLDGFFYFLGERHFNLTTPGIAKTIIFDHLLLRPYATFPHPNVLAGFLIVSLLLITNLSFARPSLKKYFYLPLILLSLPIFLAIFLSFSQATWLVLFFLSLIFVLTQKQLTLISKISFFIILVFLSSTIFFLYPIELESILLRLNLLKAALLIWLANPLLGVGLGNFIPALSPIYQLSPDLFPRQYMFTAFQPVHNAYLLIIAETGLIGLIIFFLVLLYFIRQLVLTQSKRFAPALLAILLISLFDHYWLTLHQTRLLFTLTLALIQTPPWRRSEKTCRARRARIPRAKGPR